MELNIKVTDTNIYVSGEIFHYSLPLPQIEQANKETEEFILLKEGEHFSSSAISLLTYEVKNRTLGLGFINQSSIYLYQNVPLLEVIELLISPSLGDYYNAHIKGIYDSYKLNASEYLQNKNKLLK